MRTLYLHCGYHKTGSSFLQTLFARNRDTLLDGGIYFPVSDREYDMMIGNISPGNASQLASALGDSDENKTKELLAQWIGETEKNDCNSLLLSSEELFHAFAESGALDCLVKVATSVGIKDINVLVYFRDPVSHALSTYKHRAKNGNIDDFSHWLEHDYETPGLLETFTEYQSSYPIKWSCRKYIANSTFMAESAFVDWLGLSLPDIPEDDQVNASLTFSEIQAIKSLKLIYPNIVDQLKEEFKKLSKKDKGHDKELITLHQNIAIQKLLKYKGVIRKVNKSLKESEELILPEAGTLIPAPQTTEMLLSESQLLAIGRALNKAIESEELTAKLRDISKKVVTKFNRILIRNQVYR